MSDLFRLEPERQLLSFGEWKAELAKEFAKQSDMTDSEAVRLIEGCGDECWAEMWQDGLSPREAVSEEISNWDAE